MDSLPSELLTEIMSYIQDGTSLQGFQLSLTCRYLYGVLQPVLGHFQVNQLIDAQGRGDLIVRNLSKSKGSEPTWDTLYQPERLMKSGFRAKLEAAFGISSTPVGPNPDETQQFPSEFQLAYIFKPSNRSNVPEIWSLQSLVSKNSVSLGLRRVRLIWGSGLWETVGGEGVGGQAFSERQRALEKLIEAFTSRRNGMEATNGDPGVELRFIGTCSRNGLWFGQGGLAEPSAFFSHVEVQDAPRSIMNANFGSRRPDGKKVSLIKKLVGRLSSSTAHAPTRVEVDLPRKEPGWVPCWKVHSKTKLTAFGNVKLSSGALESTSRLDRLYLQTCTIQPFWYPHLQNLIFHCPSTLTHLHLDSCPTRSFSGLAPLDWHAMIATWPRFDKLTHLKITNTGTLPIPVILSFLHANPSVEVVQLLIPPVRDHNLPETSPQLVGLELNIKELTATPWDLGAFLSFQPILPHLESLEIHQVKASVWEEGTTEWDRIAQFIQHSAPPNHLGAQGGLQKLKLSFLDEYRLEEWLYSAVASPWTGGRKDGTLREPTGEIALVKALASCPSLTFLHVSTRDVPRRLYFHPDTVVEFIAAFPSLQTVILQGLFYNSPDDHRGKNSSAFWRALARLWEVRSSLRTVEIRDLTEGSESGAAVWRDGRKEGPTGGLDLYRGAFPWAGIIQSENAPGG